MARDDYKKMFENQANVAREYEEARRALEENPPSQESRDAWALATILGAGVGGVGSSLDQEAADKKAVKQYLDTYSEKYGNTIQQAFSGVVQINSKSIAQEQGYQLEKDEFAEVITPLRLAGTALAEIQRADKPQKKMGFAAAVQQVSVDDMKGIKEQMLGVLDTIQQLYLPHAEEIKQFSQPSIGEFVESLESGRLKEAIEHFPEAALTRLMSSQGKSGGASV